jgi:molybdenum cofactor cytidylyltransferase
VGEHPPATTARVVAVVLAAGTASRFGSPKALAVLEGRPLLQHVLDTVADAGLSDVIVVLGTAAGDVERAMTWHAERRIVNPAPERGLASSLQVGLAALQDDAAAALIVLGDQPRLRASVVRGVIEAWRGSDRPIVVPRYPRDGALNPVVLARSVFAQAFALSGDRGMGPLIKASPELVLDVPVDGDNPDVDTLDDLARLTHSEEERSSMAVPDQPTPAPDPQRATQLEAAWADRVRANRAQVDRLREVPDGADFYVRTSSIFRADPFRADDPVLSALVGLALPSDTWLDIGAGAGRFALPLARIVREVIALDPSRGMLEALREGMAESGIANVKIVEGRWPALAVDLSGDVSLLAHVGYDIEAIGPFLSAMESASARLCVAVMMEQPPAALAYPFWPGVHGEERVPLPALGELLALLEARGREVSVQRIQAEPRRWATADELMPFLRQQTWVAPDGAKDRRLAAAVAGLPREADGAIRLDSPQRGIGIVSWRPR